MPYFVKFKEKKTLDNSDTLCCWCYEISDSNPTFMPDTKWGLDFPTAIDIKDPANYTECNNYTLDFMIDKDGNAKWVPSITIDAQTDKFEICFIAPCKEDKNTEVSLASWGGNRWWTHEFEGSKEMLGPAAAAVVPEDHDILAFVARYEGLKLAHLLSRATFAIEGIEVTSPPSVEPPRPETPEAPITDVPLKPKKKPSRRKRAKKR